MRLAGVLIIAVLLAGCLPYKHLDVAFPGGEITKLRVDPEESYEEGDMVFCSALPKGLWNSHTVCGTSTYWKKKLQRMRGRYPRGFDLDVGRPGGPVADAGASG